MIAVDTTILVHAHRSDSSLNEVALLSVGALAGGRDTWAIPWPCVHEFLAVVTNPRIFRPPTPLSLAIEQVEIWMASPSLMLLGESSHHWANLTALLRDGRATGGQVHDARIAALCSEHGVRELWTADRDFTRFPEIATFNPLTTDQVHETAPAYAAAQRARTAGRRRTARDAQGENAEG